MMIALMGASAIALSALQASIEAPTTSLRTCLHDAADKATGEKVSADTIETYLRNACTVQMGTLKSALIAFRIKNGMTKKAAADDAEMTVEDYVSTPADNYKFMAKLNAPKAAAPTAPASAQASNSAPAKATVTPAAAKTPASSPQPPKP
jgi:hypothetical protein